MEILQKLVFMLFYICQTFFQYYTIEYNKVRGINTKSFFQNPQLIHYPASNYPQSGFFNPSALSKIPFASLTSQQLILNYMSYPKKTHKIKKQAIKESAPVKQENSEQQAIEGTENSNSDNQKISKGQETPKKSIKIDPRTISNLSEQERQKFKSEHPQINEYFTMTSRDKSKFFHLLNQKYRSEIKLPEPPGSAPMKKTIRFKKRFQIKHFCYIQKCQLLKARKSKMQLYKAKDESKPKSISKFPRNN